MSDRVDVDDTLPPVPIPRRILGELYNHARESLPEECCGLIVGRAGERFQDAVRCRNEMTKLHLSDPQQFPRSGHEAFWMNALDYQRAQQEAEREGRVVTAVYHSHVNVGAYLSEMDVEYAVHRHFPFPGAAHIVLSISGDGNVNGKGLFERRGPDRRFVGQRILEK